MRSGWAIVWLHVTCAAACCLFCMQSFACDIDIEDLGLSSRAACQLGPITAQQLEPAALLQQPPPLPARKQQPFGQQLQQLQRGSVLAPGSVQQVLEALAAAQAAGVPAHLLAGNTGAGVYHEQWQAARVAAAIMLQGVPELQQLELQQGAQLKPANNSAGLNGLSNGSMQQHSSSSDPAAGVAMLVAGAAVTLSQLQRALQGVAAQHRRAQTAASNLQQMVAHIGRIAGALVRNAATLGGHLALVRSRALESDLLPIFIAAGEWGCAVASVLWRLAAVPALVLLHNLWLAARQLFRTGV